MKIKITGASHFVNRMFEAAGPYQWVRETLRNSIEAEAKRVEFGIEWQAVKAKNIYRRTAADDGRGMSAGELQAFFSTLGASAKTIGSVHENFGVGAKIATLPWNPEGVVVCSWKNGAGSMIWIVLNEQNGDYELVEFATSTGRHVCIEPTEIDGIDWAKIKPDWIKDHGTIVVFLGDSKHPDTAAGHPLAGGHDIRGISSYLNTRFWDLSDVDVRVAEFRNVAKSKWPKGPDDSNDLTRAVLRRARGAKHYLEATKEEKVEGGTMELDGGRVKLEWFLSDGKKRAVHSYARETGYIAVKYGDELYQPSTSKAHYRWFGVGESQVQSRLSIIVTPQILGKARWGVYPDQARNNLLFAGNGQKGVELPVSGWAYEFAEKMPKAIMDAIRMARGSDTATEGRVSNEYRERLGQRFGARWSRKALFPANDGELKGGEGLATIGYGGPLGGEREETEDDGGVRATMKPAEPTTKEILDKGKREGKSKDQPIDIPRYRLTHSSDFEQPWHLASWAPHEAGGPTVLVNVDSPILQEIVEYRQKQYPEVYQEEVAKEIRRCIGEVAACKVAHSQRLAGVVAEEVLDAEYRNEKALTIGLMGLIAEESLISQRLKRFHAKAA